MNTYTYAIISSADLSKVDFNQVHETSADTVRKSIDDSQCVIEYGSEPSFITDGSVATVSVLDHAGALTLMATEDWTAEMII